MANPALQEWDRLCKLCNEAHLPQPVMQPGGLKDTISVEIPEYTKRISKDAERAICDCIIWALAYRAGYKTGYKDGYLELPS